MQDEEIWRKSGVKLRWVEPKTNYVEEEAENTEKLAKMRSNMTKREQKKELES